MSAADPTLDHEPIVQGAEPHLVGGVLAQELHDARWNECEVALISGGKSNLTYRVSSAAGEVILRRPPLGHILPTAHDMSREYRVLTALYGTAVPVPRTLLLRGEDSPLGAPFYVMERVLGHICRDSLPAGYADSPEQRAAVGDGLVGVLAALHSIDPESVGLGDFGRPDGFMERQVRRWSQQWEHSKTADLPDLDRLRDRLGASVPRTTRTSIVHGDYRLDNTMLHPTEAGRIVGVLDWELSTLGDPLADLGALLAYWSEEGDDQLVANARIVPAVTAAPGFPTRTQVVERYAQLTGFDVSAIDWYQAFAYFKVAIICQGIAARVAGGAMLGSGWEMPERLVESLVEIGLRCLDAQPD